ncbi:hypothetical protein ACLOJK_007824, partial [Asimina triloba]
VTSGEERAHAKLLVREGNFKCRCSRAYKAPPLEAQFKQSTCARATLSKAICVRIKKLFSSHP